MALKIATKLVDSFACAKIPARETCFRRKHLYLFVCVACAEFVCLIWLTTSKAPVKAFMDHFGAFEFKEKKYVVLLNCLLSYRSRKYFLVDQRKTSTKNTEIPWKGILKGNTTKYFELIFLILRLSYNKLNKYVKMTENLHLAVIFITCSQAGWSEMRYLVICLF